MNDIQRETAFTLREKVRKLSADTSRCRQRWPEVDAFRRVQGLLGQLNIILTKYLEDDE